MRGASAHAILAHMKAHFLACPTSRSLRGLLRLFSVVWCACLLLCTPEARALDLQPLPQGPLGMYTQTFVERAERLDFAQARDAWQAGQFQPGKRRVLVAGLGAAPVWQQLELNNTQATHLHVRLAAGMSWIDQLDVYLRYPDGSVMHWETGDSLPGAKNVVPGLGMTFELTLPPGKSELFVRAQTADPMVVPLELRDADGQREAERLHAYGYGILYGFLLALLAYNAVLFFGLRAASHLYYSLYLLGFIAVNLAYTGHGFVWVWPLHPEFQGFIILVLMVLFGALGLVFANQFLDTRVEAARVWWWMRLLVWGGVVGIAILALLGQQEPAVWFAFGYLGFVSILVVTLGLWSRKRHQPAANYFLAAAVCGMGGTFATTFSTWGLLPMSTLSFHAIDLGIMAEATLFALALAARYNQLRQEKAKAQRSQLEAQAEALAAKQTVVDTLRESEHVLESRVADRTTELSETIVELRQTQGALVAANTEILALNDTLESRVEERTRELAQARGSLDTARVELAQSEARATLVAMVASITHEMGTPIGNSLVTISAMRDQLDGLSKSIFEGQLRRSELDRTLALFATGSDLIERSLDRANQLIHSFKQGAADQFTEQRREFDLQVMVNETLTLLRPSLKRAAHRIDVDIPAGLNFDSYPGPLGQVFINLINNAWNHAFEGIDQGTVTLRAEAIADASGSVRIEVVDNGNGMSADVQARLFEPFFTTKAGKGGTGLGMSIVAEIVSKTLGGSLAVDSAPDQGTRFVISIPRHPAA